MSNSEQEMLWIEGWSELIELYDNHGPLDLLDTHGSELCLDDAKALIQTQAYQGRIVRFTSTKDGARDCLLLTFSQYEGDA